MEGQQMFADQWDARQAKKRYLELRLAVRELEHRNLIVPETVRAEMQWCHSKYWAHRAQLAAVAVKMHTNDHYTAEAL